MKSDKQERLHKKGWATGGAADFLGLTTEETIYIRLKIALSRSLKKYRKKNRLTQTELARLLRSSQSRVAKMEACDPSVSVDLLVRALLALGATPKQLAKAIAEPESAARAGHKLER